MYKNRAITGFPFGLISRVDLSPVTTGAVSGYVTLDGGTQTALSGTAVHEGNGQWSIDLTAAETNGDVVGLAFIHSTAVPVFFTIPTTVATSGAVSWSYTLTETSSGDPIAGADIWITTDLAGANVIAKGVTDAFGVANFDLDPGTYYVWRQLAGYDFVNPDTEVVT